MASATLCIIMRAFSSPSAGIQTSPPPALRPVRPPQRPQRGSIRLGAATARFAHYLTRPLLDFGPVFFGAAVLAVLYSSWLDRNEGHLTPENGFGYWFGIADGVMMLVMLLYPLRKRVRALRVLGRVPTWFRMHMILGIAGPTLVIVHSNWKLSSPQRHGCNDRHADRCRQRHCRALSLPQTAQLLDELGAFDARILAPRHGFLSQSWAFLTLGMRRALMRGRLMRLANTTISSEGKRRGWERSAKASKLGQGAPWALFCSTDEGGALRGL